VLATSNGERSGLNGAFGGTGKSKKVSAGASIRGGDVSMCLAVAFVVGWVASWGGFDSLR
jgi:hypothetical protein